MVTMTSFIDSAVDPASPEVIELCDVSMGARPVDDERCEVERSKTKVSFALPTLVELPNALLDECKDEIGTNMSRSDCKPKSVRSGRKYRPAQIQPFVNGHHHQHQHQNQTGVSVGNKTALSSPRDWQSSLREGSNGHTTPWNSSFASSKLPSSPRSPRLPRQLPSLSRSDSQEFYTNSPRENDIGTGDGGAVGDNMNASGLKGEALDHDGECPVNCAFHHCIPLPTASSVFQKIMTDFHDRTSASLDTSSPGDLMVRRSSLARTTLGSPPLLQVDEVSDVVSRMNDLGLDIELAPPSGSDNEDDKKKTHSMGNTNHPISKDKNPQTLCKVNEDNVSKKNIKKTSPRRDIKFPVESKLPTCAITDDDSTANPGVVISVPTEDSLKSTSASHGHPGQKTRSRLRSREAATSVTGDSWTGSTEMLAGSPERSSKPRRKISDHHRPITPARSHHEHESTIDMKTAGQIIRFITAAAASSTAPGLNRNQQLLPSDIRLPVVDPSGRLLHRNRDESMRLVKQAVDLNAGSEEKSDVYSWDELRDCRYLRTKKNPRESRRNSLLGFNEI